MSEYEIPCAKCQTNVRFDDDMLGQAVQCPECGNDLVLSSPPAVPVGNPAATHEAGEAPAEAGRDVPMAAAPPAALPERMKANKLVAGKTCGGCGKAVEFGQNVFNCQDCSATMHEECRERLGGCTGCSVQAPPDGTPSIADKDIIPLAAIPPKAKLKVKGASAASSDPGAEDQKLIPCRFCGEKILSEARLCKHCGEFQNEVDRQRQQKTMASASGEDEKLEIWEILVSIFCGVVGCIIGIVYLCQGKKKGWKMIAISVVSNIVSGAIQGLLKIGGE